MKSATVEHTAVEYIVAKYTMASMNHTASSDTMVAMEQTIVAVA